MTPSAITSEITPPIVEAPKAEDFSALAALGLKEKQEAEIAVTPPEEKKVDPPKVQEYEIELRDDSPLSETDLDEIVVLAQKYKWTKEESDSHIKGREDLHNRGVDKIRADAMATIKKQKEEFLKDPVFAGDKLVESLTTIDEAVKKFGDPGLREYLRGPGGNNLPLAKFLLKIGNQMKMDTMQGRGTMPKAEKVDSHENSLKNMYPNFFPKDDN